MSGRTERLKAILQTPGQRDERQLRLECLRLGHEIERRQAVLNHARAFVDFVRRDELEHAEE